MARPIHGHPRHALAISGWGVKLETISYW